MQTILSDFNWFRHADGYRIVGKRSLPGRLPPMDRIVANGDDRKAYRVDQIDVLYKKFAAVTTPDKLLEFVNLFGSLTDDGPEWDLDDRELMLAGGPYEGQSVSECLSHADMFRKLMNYRGKGRRYLGAYFRSQEYRRSRKLGALGSVQLQPDAAGDVHLRVVPHNLLQALQLQLGQVLAGERNFRPCLFCGGYFECGPGAKRGDSKYCSDDHRKTFNSHKRSK